MKLLGLLLAGCAALHVQASPWQMASAASSSEPSVGINYTQTIHWFGEQLLNHFNMTDHRTWSQRYFVIDDFWSPPNGPIILHICGEYTCQGIMPARQTPLLMAKEHKALVVTLEHRFFGESFPLEATSSNLAFHNSRQAVNDLAWFSKWFQETAVNQKYGLPTETRNKWTVVGGSYPGALAAWYRLKFPQLSVGSHSSSGVVKAILDFTQFDEQVARTAGPTCAAALRNTTKQIEAGMPGIKAQFGAQGLAIDGDFFYFIADAGAETMQYGHRNVLCDVLNPIWEAGEDPLPAFVKFVNNYFMGTLGNSPSDYDSTLLADPVKGGNGRSWWWQKCTELAYWQVAPAQNSIRSAQVNEAYHRDLCLRVFGVTELPAVNETNNYYGGTDVAVENVFFYNGAADPWQWAGVRAPLGPTRPAYVVDCGVNGTCAHCGDLYTPSDSDPIELQQERKALFLEYQKWLA